MKNYNMCILNKSMSRQKKKFCLKEREEEAFLSSNGSNKSVGAH